MTICIGLIPNEKTVMLLQDSETTYEGVGFTQDITEKIRKINDDCIVGSAGISWLVNEVTAVLSANPFTNARQLKELVEEAYHSVREEHLSKGLLRKYGFKSIREVTNPQQGTFIDPTIREEIIKAAGGSGGEFSLSLMLAYNKKAPLLYTVRFPGESYLENNRKMFMVFGSGSIMALDKLGEELEKYKWQKELSIEEGIDVLLRAGKASEKHVGVGGPFDITYMTKGGENQNLIVKPNQKKINMVMYLFPLGVDETVLLEAIARMRDDKVTAEQLAEYIKTNTKVGMEFEKYFGLKDK